MGFECRPDQLIDIHDELEFRGSITQTLFKLTRRYLGQRLDNPRKAQFWNLYSGRNPESYLRRI